MIGFFIMLWIMALLTGCSQEPQITATTDSYYGTEIMDITTEEPPMIYVYVCGHVEKPGVYTFFPDSRICDAIEAAGGVTADGEGQALNQAELLQDGQKVYVPGMGEDLATSNEDDGKVNINLATKEELMTLPGIGESKALLIIEYREEHGVFETIEDLMNIPGIKEGVFHQIKECIKVS